MTYSTLRALLIFASFCAGSTAETSQCGRSSGEACRGQDSSALLQAHMQIDSMQVAEATETIKLRADVLFNKDALTEGPRRFQLSAHKRFDSLEAYRSHHSKSTQQMYIVGWKPVVNKHKCADGSMVELVHHMCVHSMHQSSHDKNPEEMHNSKGLHLVASYDRGSTEYHLPAGYGIPIDKLTLEHHLLLPPCWDLSQSVTETSGMDLYVTTQKPKKLAALVGFTDEHMRIEPGNGIVEQVSEASPESLRPIFNMKLPASLAEMPDGDGPTLDLLAVHMHTHDISTSKSFEVLNQDGTSLFRSKEEATGYGDKQQSFIAPQKKGIPSKVKPGQSFRMHCRYDTSKLHHEVVDGTSRGEEMCSALMIVGGDALNPEVVTLISENHGVVSLLGH